MRKLITGLLAAFIFIGPAAAAPGEKPLFKKGVVTVAQGGRSAALAVEVAGTPGARARGLMHRESLPPDAGMLFIYPRSAPRAFWMKNTRIPLSAAYISPGWRITEIVRMNLPAPGESAPTYPSKEPARYVLEVNQGWFERNGFGVGAKVIFKGE